MYGDRFGSTQQFLGLAGWICLCRNCYLITNVYLSVKLKLKIKSLDYAATSCRLGLEMPFWILKPSNSKSWQVVLGAGRWANGLKQVLRLLCHAMDFKFSTYQCASTTLNALAPAFGMMSRNMEWWILFSVHPQRDEHFSRERLSEGFFW